MSCIQNKTGEKQKRRVCCSKTIPKVLNKIRRAAMKKVLLLLLLLLRINICRAPVYESARARVCTSSLSFSLSLSLSLSRLCYQWFCASLIFVLVLLSQNRSSFAERIKTLQTKLLVYNRTNSSHVNGEDVGFPWLSSPSFPLSLHQVTALILLPCLLIKHLTR